MTRVMLHNIRPDLVGYWGQEWDFLDWLCTSNIIVTRASRLYYRRFLSMIGLPLIERDSLVYPRLAVAAVAFQIAAKERGEGQRHLLEIAAHMLETADPIGSLA